MRVLLGIIFFVLFVCWNPAFGAELPSPSFGIVAGETSYRLQSGESARIRLFRPQNAGGRVPLFIWVHGTACNYDDPITHRILKSFAERGIVAASVEYSNGLLEGHACTVISIKAERIFSEILAGSAVNAIRRAAPEVNTGLGILVGGFSQGANIASLAKNYNHHVQAAWLMGAGTEQTVGYTIDLSCTAVSVTGLTKMRAINGIMDEPDGGGYKASPEEKEENNRSNLIDLTGICPTCTGLKGLADDASGWELVPNSAVVDQQADHFYFYKTPVISPVPEQNWDTTSDTWGRRFNVEWLISQLQN